MTLLQTDPSAQVIALVIQSIGAVILGLLFWIGRKAAISVKQIHVRLDHLDACVDMQGKEATATRAEVRKTLVETQARDEKNHTESVARDEKIAQLRVDYGKLEGWILGAHQMPIDKPITDIDPANGGSS